MHSLAFLSNYIYETIQGKPSADTAGEARALALGVRAGFDLVMANKLIDDPRVMHLPFKELSADPLAAVRKIYDRYGTPVSPEFEAAMRGWLADPENATDRFGRYPYSHEQLGMTREWVEELFADYSKRFGLD